MLLRDEGVVYYFDFEAIIPVKEGTYHEAEVIDVPRGGLAVYPQKNHLERAYVQLGAAVSVAQVRQGPGRQYDEMGIIANKLNLCILNCSSQNYGLKMKSCSWTLP